ncbi:DUF1998 domain-containing protein [Streptomyces ipomoeae]|uniref:DUF1998 domain-containing protein n=1 Tax=Streptomyces ipomoeae TaxID=103232 RepID=UPI001FD5A562|nr:DUF1998 domain-containing protein [Streptomyces ipomoeae]MDX2938259.1 DUF1998 domain-containing protein [Streptomyces ipomoeae]
MIKDMRADQQKHSRTQFCVADEPELLKVWGVLATRPCDEYIVSRVAARVASSPQGTARERGEERVPGGRPAPASDATAARLRSRPYALLEGAAARLEISRDDIDGSVHTGTDGMPSLLLFDTTPGGAGNAVSMGKQLQPVVAAAPARGVACVRGPESSCYACLRNFREPFHELLSRREAVALPDALTGDAS